MGDLIVYFSKEMQEASLKLSRKWEDEVQKALKIVLNKNHAFLLYRTRKLKRLYTPEDIKD